MTFEEILDHATAMLRRRRRVAYRTLKVQLDLDDDTLEALKDELLYAQRVARDEDGRVLVWCGDASPPPSAPTSIESHTPDAERRQLTVLFCDLVESTTLAGRLLGVYVVRAELEAGQEVAEHLLSLAHLQHDTAFLAVAQWALGQATFFQGELAAARVHLEQAIALYDSRQHHALGLSSVFPADLGVFCRCFAAHALWHLGYLDQSLQRMDEALALAQELAHPYSRALALDYAAMLYQFRGDGHMVHESAETAITLCIEQGFAYYLAWATIMQGWVLAGQGQGEAGMARMRHGLAAMRATGAELRQPYYLALLAEACRQTGRAEVGLTLLAEALTEADKTREHWRSAELHRLRGELLLHSSVGDSEAEQCFHQALDIARHQQAKALELRAAVSLARLWQRQGKRADARELLAPIYGWFTEGFDTADLQEGAAVLEALAERANGG